MSYCSARIMATALLVATLTLTASAQEKPTQSAEHRLRIQSGEDLLEIGLTYNQPPDRTQSRDPYAALARAEDLYRGLVEDDPTDVDTLLSLARCRMGLAKYTEARQTYEEALRLFPTNMEAKTGLTEAVEYSQVQGLAQRKQKPGVEVLRLVRSTREAGKPVWFVLSGRLGEPSEWAQARDISGVTLAAYDFSSQALRPLWQTSLPAGVSNEANLYVLDLTGDGIPEAVIETVFYGGSAAPGSVLVCQWRRNKMVLIGNVGGQTPCWVEDIYGDGLYEIGSSNAIGVLMCHAEMPYWTDIYAYRDGKYVVANREFPKEFVHWADELALVLEQYPEDYDIGFHLGRVCEILGDNDSALRVYHRAELACQRTAAADPSGNPWAENGLGKIRGRIKSLSQKQ